MISLIYVLLLKQTNSKVQSTKPVVQTQQAWLQAVKKWRSTMDDFVYADAFSIDEFQKAFPKAKIPIWERLQKQANPNSMIYADLACALAWYGVAYDKNIRALYRPYVVFKRSVDEYDKTYSADNHGELDKEFAEVSRIPAYLEVLYIKNHDGKLVDLLLDMNGLDGIALDQFSFAVTALCESSFKEMLAHSSNSSLRQKNIAKSLLIASYDEATNTYHVDRTALNKLAQDNDEEIVLAARQILSALDVEVKHFQELADKQAEAEKRHKQKLKSHNPT